MILSVLICLHVSDNCVWPLHLRAAKTKPKKKRRVIDFSPICEIWGSYLLWDAASASMKLLGILLMSLIGKPVHAWVCLHIHFHGSQRINVSFCPISMDSYGKNRKSTHPFVCNNKWALYFFFSLDSNLHQVSVMCWVFLVLICWLVLYFETLIVVCHAGVTGDVVIGSTVTVVFNRTKIKQPQT